MIGPLRCEPIILHLHSFWAICIYKRSNITNMGQRKRFLWFAIVRLLLFLTQGPVSAQHHEITLSYNNESLATIFKRIEQVSDY